MSEYASRWGDKDKKVQEFKTLFPEEYTGNLYAGRSDNRWVTYNLPDKQPRPPFL